MIWVQPKPMRHPRPRGWLSVCIAAVTVVVLTACGGTTERTEQRGFVYLADVGWNGQTIDLSALVDGTLTDLGAPSDVIDGLLVLPRDGDLLLSFMGNGAAPSVVVSGSRQVAGGPPTMSYVYTPTRIWLMTNSDDLGEYVEVTVGARTVSLWQGIGVLDGDHAWESLTLSTADPSLQGRFVTEAERLWAASGTKEGYLEWLAGEPAQVVAARDRIMGDAARHARVHTVVWAGEAGSTPTS